MDSKILLVSCICFFKFININFFVSAAKVVKRNYIVMTNVYYFIFFRFEDF